MPSSDLSFESLSALEAHPLATRAVVASSPAHRMRVVMRVFTVSSTWYRCCEITLAVSTVTEWTHPLCTIRATLTHREVEPIRLIGDLCHGWFHCRDLDRGRHSGVEGRLVSVSVNL